MTVTGITRMNIAAMADETLVLLRDELNRAGTDRGLIAEYVLAIEGEIARRRPLYVCDECNRPAHRVAGATENGQPVEIWHHDSVADDVFCGLVMHAADRLPR